jgi:hypothetical protein
MSPKLRLRDIIISHNTVWILHFKMRNTLKRNMTNIHEMFDGHVLLEDILLHFK